MKSSPRRRLRETYSSNLVWLSWWEGGIRQQLNVITFLPELSSPSEQDR